MKHSHATLWVHVRVWSSPLLLFGEVVGLHRYVTGGSSPTTVTQLVFLIRDQKQSSTSLVQPWLCGLLSFGRNVGLRRTKTTVPAGESMSALKRSPTRINVASNPTTTSKWNYFILEKDSQQVESANRCMMPRQSWLWCAGGRPSGWKASFSVPSLV